MLRFIMTTLLITASCCLYLPFSQDKEGGFPVFKEIAVDKAVFEKMAADAEKAVEEGRGAFLLEQEDLWNLQKKIGDNIRFAAFDRSSLEDEDHETSDDGDISMSSWDDEEASSNDEVSFSIDRMAERIDIAMRMETLERARSIRRRAAEELERLLRIGRSGELAYLYAITVERYAGICSPVTNHELMLIRSGQAMSCLDLEMEDNGIGKDEKRERLSEILASYATSSGGKTERRKEKGRRVIPETQEEREKVNLAQYSERSTKVDYFRLFLYIWEDIPGEWIRLKIYDPRYGSARIYCYGLSRIYSGFYPSIKYITSSIRNILKSYILSNKIIKNLNISFLNQKIHLNFPSEPNEQYSLSYAIIYNSISIRVNPLLSVSICGQNSLLEIRGRKIRENPRLKSENIGDLS